MNLSDGIGFVGVTILLVAFLLNLFKKIAVNSYAYILMNLAGAGLACLASILINYIPFIILEGAWTTASLVGLIRMAMDRKTS